MQHIDCNKDYNTCIADFVKYIPTGIYGPLVRIYTLKCELHVPGVDVHRAGVFLPGGVTLATRGHGSVKERLAGGLKRKFLCKRDEI